MRSRRWLSVRRLGACLWLCLGVTAAASTPITPQRDDEVIETLHARGLGLRNE